MGVEEAAHEDRSQEGWSYRREDQGGDEGGSPVYTGSQEDLNNCFTTPLQDTPEHCP